MSDTSRLYTCPACDAVPDFTPWQEDSASDEIYPYYNIQFGYDDIAGGDPDARHLVYKQWRDRWISDGAHWWSPSQPKPVGWSVAAQLLRIGVGIES